MSETEAERKAHRFERLTRGLYDMGGVGGITKSAERFAFWVPGRIEVLGKHTDYGGGRSLLCATERGICTVAGVREDRVMRIRDANSGETVEFELSPDIVPTPGGWPNYPMTVARRVVTNFSGPMRGADIIFASDLPPAAGVSSSSALVVSIFLALSAANDLPARPEYCDNIHTSEDPAGYLGSVENGLSFKALHGHVGVGTFGGSEDQTAILCSRPNAVAQYSFCPVRPERVIPLPDDYRFVIGTSGVLAEKAGAALEPYNRVSRRLRAALDYWRRATKRADSSMGEAVASSPDAAEHIREVLRGTTNAEYPTESLIQRFEQFRTETVEIIPAAGDALARGDLRKFGELVELSQRGAEIALGNQIRETITLVRQARELGAVAASAFGAGFGGSVWALVPVASLATFCDSWAEAYESACPTAAAHAKFFSTHAGPPAIRIQLR